MKATRKTQPYRKGAREPGTALDMILAGRSPTVGNPADQRRQLMLILRKVRRG